MEPTRTPPVSLKVVAGIFIFEGACAALEILVSLARGHLNLNFGVLGILVGVGLLRFSRGWRTCGLVFLWIALILIPLAVLLVLAGSGPLKFKVFGQDAGEAPKEVALVFAVVVFSVSLWQYRVLTRPDVRHLFGLDSPERPPVEKV